MADPTAVAAPDMLTALARRGGYVAGIRAAGRVVGGGYGWPAHVDGEWRLHSHVVGFLSAHRAGGLGAMMKQHQRQWARDQGLVAVEWTYDPLHAANAHFNLNKLGAHVVGFYDDFYGPVSDAFQRGHPTDRFLLRWGLDDVAQPRPDSAPVAVLRAVNDLPVVREARGAAVISAEIPADIVTLRRRNDQAGAQWQRAFRLSVGAAIASGATVVGFTRQHEYLIATRE